MEENEQVLIDETDKKIINCLLDNSRLSYRDIAKQIDVSVVTVMNRTKRLESAGVVRGYSANIDYEKIGYDVSVMIEMNISKGKLFEVEKKIAVNNSVSAVYDITGQSDAVIIARFKSRKKMDDFLKKIQTFDFVEKTQTKLILNIIKEKNMILLE